MDWFGIVAKSLSEDEEDREFVCGEAHGQVTQPTCKIPLFTRTRDAWESVMRNAWCVHPPPPRASYTVNNKGAQAHLSIGVGQLTGNTRQ
jgi:hypothetical protein